MSARSTCNVKPQSSGMMPVPKPMKLLQHRNVMFNEQESNVVLQRPQETTGVLLLVLLGLTQRM